MKALGDLETVTEEIVGKILGNAALWTEIEKLIIYNAS